MPDNRITHAVFPPAKRWAYLAGASTARVASLNEDGTIYLSPLWFVVRERRLFLVIDSARHGENFDAGRVVTVLVDQGEEYRSLSGLQLHGTVHQVEDEVLLAEMPGLLFDKYFHVGHPHADSYFEFGEWSGRRYYEFVSTKTVGWDSRESTHPQSRERRLLPPGSVDRRVRVND
ncbi:pyridoxamine 5'-phosphate oxidase family protein [Pseudonocardia xishanensis]|uniref:Pyridoxamine 5'-phosphate oxidase N-terminal domain-containing protein n=1 Tax=Pseudonocardia xishanensis TaxID=630995 RepID=A0ABP8S0G9_9PSEU